MANKICFIVGHGKSANGGYDSGAVSKDGKYHEFKIVKEIAKYAQEYFNANYVEQSDLMNYNGDLYLTDRIKKANAKDYLVIAEIHLNSSTGTSANGVECYYENKDAKGRQYADAICDEIAKTLGVKQRPNSYDSDGGDKVKLNAKGKDYFGIIRQTTKVDIRLLVETVFISNTSDLSKVNTAGGQKMAGEAIAKAIATTYGATKKNTTGWQQDSKGWYYVKDNGQKAKNEWVQDSKGWCYLDANGYCVTNQWKEIKGEWYYFDTEGRCAKENTWQQINNRWYYFNDKCAAVTGLHKINGKLFYFAEKSEAGLDKCQLIITNDNGEIQL